MLKGGSKTKLLEEIEILSKAEEYHSSIISLVNNNGFIWVDYAVSVYFISPFKNESNPNAWREFPKYQKGSDSINAILQKFKENIGPCLIVEDIEHFAIYPFGNIVSEELTKTGFMNSCFICDSLEDVTRIPCEELTKIRNSISKEAHVAYTLIKNSAKL